MDERILIPLDGSDLAETISSFAERIAGGFRVDGPYEPTRGLRFNPAKLLIDPYARALAGRLEWREEVFGYRIGDPAADLAPDDRDSAGCVPKAVVIDGSFDWEGDRPPQTPWHRSVLYEVHVKGFTARHPAVPPELRGTYAGLVNPAALDYLTGLGITAVELLPVHHHVDEQSLVRRGLVNYWGYNSIAFFAPDARFSACGDSPPWNGHVREFKTMVKALHRAGIEVILDVAYAHTAEGDHLGPTVGFRGIDNPAYYRLDPRALRYYRDYTGCGNTLSGISWLRSFSPRAFPCSAAATSSAALSGGTTTPIARTTRPRGTTGGWTTGSAHSSPSPAG